MTDSSTSFESSTAYPGNTRSDPSIGLIVGGTHST